MDRATFPELGPIKLPRASNVLANQLRERILSGGLAESSMLPTERELVAQTGLSRASVREAIRILEVEGLLTTRPGRNGGTRVRRPDGRELMHSLEMFIRGSQVNFGTLLEVREAIEPAAARHAAENRTEDDLRALTDANAALRRAAEESDAAKFLDENVRWHMAVVTASHNTLFVAIMSALSRLIHEATEAEVFDRDDIRHATVRAHDGVVRAITRSDADAASRRMARHVTAAGEIVAAYTSDQPHKRTTGA